MWLLTGAEHPGFGFQAVENLWDCMIQAVENLWDCMIQVCVPCRICFVSNSLIQWNSNLSCFSRLTSLPRRLISRWLGLAQGTPWSAVVSHPCPPPLLSKAEAGPSLPRIPCPSRRSPLVLAEAGQPTMLLSLPPGWVCGVSR